MGNKKLLPALSVSLLMRAMSTRPAHVVFDGIRFAEFLYRRKIIWISLPLESPQECFRAVGFFGQERDGTDMAYKDIACQHVLPALRHGSQGKIIFLPISLAECLFVE